MAEDISWKKYADRFRTFPKLIHDPLDPSVGMIICIPVCAEPDIFSTLDSLYQSHMGELKTEVIVLFNKNSMMTEAEIFQHDQSWNECVAWISEHRKEGLTILPVFVGELPDPKGGVGWARKIAMDEAARRLGANGIIVCLDADCIVEGNYLKVIFDHFMNNKTHDAASVFFEHKLDQLDNFQRDAIVTYELHLRYLLNAQQWCGHPFAFATVGSAMAVRRKAYLDQGGMNTRRAGEDFYFLQKFIEIGQHGEIRNTTVYPSARISARVPFGTGRAMQQIINDEEKWLTTDFQIFSLIKPMFQSIDRLRDFCLVQRDGNDYQALQVDLAISPDVIGYLKQIEFLTECRLIVKQTASASSFSRRFFRYFNSFRMIKYMHYMSDHHYPDIPVINAVRLLAKEMKLQIPNHVKEEDYLQMFRQYDRLKNKLDNSTG